MVKKLLGMIDLKKRSKRYNVMFKGRHYILIGNKREGGLFTREQAATGSVGSFYMYSDGKVREAGVLRGLRNEVVFID